VICIWVGNRRRSAINCIADSGHSLRDEDAGAHCHAAVTSVRAMDIDLAAILIVSSAARAPIINLGIGSGKNGLSIVRSHNNRSVGHADRGADHTSGAC